LELYYIIKSLVKTKITLIKRSVIDAPGFHKDWAKSLP